MVAGQLFQRRPGGSVFLVTGSVGVGKCATGDRWPSYAVTGELRTAVAEVGKFHLEHGRHPEAP
ncbi:hypothetical protein ACFWFZ_21395 [Streptomyces sp. NPDC060232]|uniref:hypothetical protein n=1 Tax=Streptomyces sp. NPDC060232 TaxID=3347079 RepID=UPI0036607EDB